MTDPIVVRTPSYPPVIVVRSPREDPPPSPPGSGGGGSTSGSYIFTQSSPAASWVITHPLNAVPNVVVLAGGDVIECDVAYSGTTGVTLTFSEPVSGTAYLYS